MLEQKLDAVWKKRYLSLHDKTETILRRLLHDIQQRDKDWTPGEIRSLTSVKKAEQFLEDAREFLDRAS